MPARATSTGCRLAVRIAPRSSRNAVLGTHDGALKIALTAPPVDGEANAALIAFVAKSLGVAKRQVRIASGATQKEKVLELDGVDVEAVRQWIAAPV